MLPLSLFYDTGYVMLEKLATNDVESVTTLFALVDKCDRAAEGHAWRSAP
jgi:hypothetical protein